MGTFPRRYSHQILFVFLCLIWGTTWLAIKVGLDDLPPFLSAAIRFIIASSLLFFVRGTKRFRDEISGREPRLFLFLMSFIWITIPYALVYWGEQYISSGLCAIFFATIPFYVAIFAHFWIVDEKLNIGKVAGLVVGFVGLILIFYDSADVHGENVIYGVVALTISPILAAIANVLAKRRIESLHPVSMNAWMMAYGAVFLLLISILSERGETVKFTGMAVFSLFYLGTIGSALAFVVYVYLLRTEAAVKMSLVAYITPVIALFVGWLFRGETVTVEVMAGSILVFLGVYIVTKRGVEVS